MSAQERKRRSRLAQLVSSHPFVRGTLLYRERFCGKSGCKCTRGEKHPALCLVVSRDGKQRQHIIPKALQQEVKTWVDNYQQIRSLLDELSQSSFETFQQLKRQG